MAPRHWLIYDCGAGRKKLRLQIQVLAGDTAGVGGYLLRGAFGHHLAAGIAAVGTHIYNVVCTLDHIRIMLNYNKSVPLGYQAVK